MIADIFVTVKNRGDLARKSLESLFQNTDKSLYRLTVIRDGNYANTSFLNKEYSNKIDYVFTNNENMGLGPSLNLATAHIQQINKWYNDSKVGEQDKVSTFISYCQDDILYTPNWLEKLARLFMLCEERHNIGFVSGIESIEHPVKRDLGGGMVLKDWIRATHMMARREYWDSMFPIPAYDPETGRLRAKPNDGIGSGVDWHVIRNAPNSICRTGKSCLVVPGTLVHAGFRDSTWLAHELPESDSDQRKIDELS